MIQVLTYSGMNKDFEGKNVKVNSLHTPQSLDEFEINIICLQDQEIWHSKKIDTTSIDTIDDFKSLSIMLKSSTKAQNIILYPQNYQFYCNTINHNSYWKKQEIKNILHDVCKYILSQLYLQMGKIEIVYENTMTSIKEKQVNAAFYFVEEQNIEVITKSIKSNKITTIRCGEIILSTLKLENYEDILFFLREIGLIQEKQSLPEWMEEVKMFDDNKQWKVIEENNQTIKIANDNISKAMEVINENNKYKSILYTNGDELVNVVFQILEKMLGCNLSEFVDEKGPDFVFELAENVFIGEIKGVNHNVKNENVSQLDYHCQCYLDDHEDVKAENIVPLLIINHQRNKPLAGREPVKETQESLAKKYGSLIVETITLLKLFEKYLNEEKTREECIDILKNNTGLLTM